MSTQISSGRVESTLKIQVSNYIDAEFKILISAGKTNGEAYTNLAEKYQTTADTVENWHSCATLINTINLVLFCVKNGVTFVYDHNGYSHFILSDSIISNANYNNKGN